jgi:hypothetical protein
MIVTKNIIPYALLHALCSKKEINFDPVISPIFHGMSHLPLKNIAFAYLIIVNFPILD